MLSEPHIEEPVACAFDGNGALYVVEMRTYMQDADATGEQEPRSRISRHEDTDGDGKYDKHSVFIDNLLLPRMVLPLDDRIMVGVTNTLDLWTYRDTDQDGVADEKVKVYDGGRRGGNMEHQPSGLIWALDNWIYITYEKPALPVYGRDAGDGADPARWRAVGAVAGRLGTVVLFNCGGRESGLLLPATAGLRDARPAGPDVP